MKFEIKSRWTGNVIFTVEAGSLRLALEAGVSQGADLKGADLEGADLKGADLEGAYLKGADLKGADLEGAYLEGAYLKWADLKGAYLKGADLKGADLKGADLEGAYLKGADLKGADLKGADLEGAYLKGADLKGADLKGAYLKGAYLKGADLEGADLKGADLEGADGKPFEIPTIEKPYTKILEAIKGGSGLEMTCWHSCDTTHCIGGWVTHFAGEAGRKLESLVDMPGAATLILKKSGARIPDYYAGNAEAMAFVEEQAKKEREAGK